MVSGLRVATKASSALGVLAEAEVPKAISDALRGGNFGLMDYYRMQNLMADTGMRAALAKPEQQS
jgi:uncharacterized protein YqfA (UPF0365 family)